MSRAPHRTFDDALTSTRLRVCELASGGMGRVDLALRREGSFRRLYAVKRLHPHLRDDAEFRAMFVDEARVAGLIQHPNVVGVLDVGEDEEGPFLVMNYIDGLSLAGLMSFANDTGDALPIQAAIRIAIEITKGLHAAHELEDHEGKPLHLVHRDLSPQNVLLGWDGTVRITDFGIAKALGRSTKTATGVVKGKSSYMSPEQLRYQDADRRSDLFTLGIILYEMVAGERLYKNRDGHDGIRRILEEPPPDIGEIRPEAPATLTALLFRMLAKDPDARLATAAEAGVRLEAILAELLEDEPAIELAPLIEEIAGDYREERKVALSALLAKAEKNAKGQMLTVAAPVEAARPNNTPWLVTGAISLLVVVGVGAWALGRLGADDPPPAAADASLEVQARTTDESPPPDPVPAPTEPEEQPSIVSPMLAEPAQPAAEDIAEVTPRMRPRMRTRMRRTMEPIEMTTMAEAEMGGSRWEEWE